MGKLVSEKFPTHLGSTAESPNLVYDEQQEQEEEVGQVYKPQSLYDSLEHPPEFYEDE